MKIKQAPEDFQVEELTDRKPSERGSFAFYRLEKCGWTTPDALQIMRRRWGIDLARVSYGGLKDRHAATIQYFSIHKGPKRNLTQQGVNVVFLGWISTPYSSHDIRANRFEITLRKLSSLDRTAIERVLLDVARDGLPNYFDDQRFGSVAPASVTADAGGNEQFVARLIVLGRYEEALQLALTGYYEHDRSAQKKEKSILTSHWGDWEMCRTLLPRGHARSLIDYLVYHPTDFRGVLERMRPELRGLYLSAFQSYLWNRMLASVVERRCEVAQLSALHLRLGDLPFPRRMTDTARTELHQLSLPLPSGRCGNASDSQTRLVEEVLAQNGLTIAQLKLKGLRKMFFSKGGRAAWFVPLGLCHELEPDDRHPGSEKLSLRFDLPRGSYATLLIKRLQTELGVSD